MPSVQYRASRTVRLGRDISSRVKLLLNSEDRQPMIRGSNRGGHSVSIRYQDRKARNKDRRIGGSRRSPNGVTGKGSRETRAEAGNALIDPDLLVNKGRKVL